MAYLDQLRAATGAIPADEIRPLLKASDFRGWSCLLSNWGILFGCFASAVWFPSALTWTLALVLVGGRQLGLAVLTHECAHRSLFRSRWLNDWAGEWLAGGPIWLSVTRYREEHLRHHCFTGEAERDPDLGLVTPYPTSRSSFFRKIFRDLVGITALRRVTGLLLMDLGYLSFSASTNALPLPQGASRPAERLRSLVRHTGPVALTNLAVLGGTLALFRSWIPFLLWMGAYFSTYSLFIRLRSLAEHAVVPDAGSALYNTRTTAAGPLVRLVLAPYGVNYHLGHHLFMQVPCYRLNDLHGVLRKHGLADDRNTAPGYWHVIRQAVR